MVAGNFWLSKCGRRPAGYALLALGLAVALVVTGAPVRAAEDEDAADSIGAHWAAFRLNEADEIGDPAGGEPQSEPALSEPPGGEPTLSTPPAGEPTPLEPGEDGDAATPSPKAEIPRSSGAGKQPEEVPSPTPLDGEGADEEGLQPVPDDGEGPFHGFPEPPAKNCSSGHWLNNGGWYSQIDFSYMQRSGPSDFAFAIDGRTDERFSSDEGLGFEPGVRLTVGEYLCRDNKNRDHALELTYFGMHDWFDKKGVSLPATSSNQDFLLSNFDQNAAGFNFVKGLQYEYGSDFDSLELNLRISHRLGRDRMELNREGCWVRKCSPAPVSSLIAGVRIASVDERFNFFATNFNGDTSGAYFVQTENDLIGLQSGFDCFFQHCRWKTGVRVKGGAYVNFAEQASQVNVPALISNPNRNEEASKDVAAFLGEVNLMGSYQLRPNVALRASLDLMWINALALGPEQINFAVRNPTDIVTGGALFYQGGSIGIEMVW